MPFNPISRRTTLATILACTGGALLPTSARAQNFPTRPILITVPFAAGGPTDAIARVLAHSMAETLGQQVQVETVVGAGGTVAAARLDKSAPDGHTLLLHHIALAAGASIYRNLSYNTAELQTLGLINSGPMILMVRNGYPGATPSEIIANLKAGAAQATLAHGGVGTNSHLCGLLLQQELGIKLAQVGYRGTGPAMNDLMSGQVDILFDQSTNAIPQLEAKSVKGVAVTADRRLAGIPDLATVRELGMPGVAFTLWHGLYAPKGTPENVVSKLNAAIGVALKDATVRARFDAFGTDLFPEEEWNPEAHKKKLIQELAKWKDVLSKSDFSINP